jgi:membrane-associated protease RseP (regulator of RpoE activity)
MTFWLLLILGLITYNILQRNVASITRTPIWLLWAVMMTPATVLTLWAVLMGHDTPVPPALAVGTFLLCFVVYWWLVSAGRIPPSKPSPDRDRSTESRIDEIAGSTPTTNTTATANTDVQNTGTSKNLKQLRPIDTEEEHQLRNCFNWSVYALHSLEYRPQAVICRGSLRTNPERAYATIRKNIESHFGDRFLIIFQENSRNEPFFLLSPNPDFRPDRASTVAVTTASTPSTQSTNHGKPTQEVMDRPWLAFGLFLVCLFTTTVAGVGFIGFESNQLPDNPAWLLRGLPYSIALLAILTAHEFGHFFAAKHYQLKSSLPYFIPIPFFLGTLGAFVQLRSPMPDRKVLFDVSIAGPIAGFILTLPLLIWGMAHSSIVAATDNSNLLNFMELQPQFSALISLICRIVLPEGLDPSKAIALHPVAIAGYLGFILTAFNLMPIGTLDGGHIVHAMFGRNTARTIAQVSRFIMLALTLLHEELFLWTLLLFLMPSQDEPALNDVTELDNRRDAVGLGCLVLLVAILMPAPKLLSAGLGF